MVIITTYDAGFDVGFKKRETIKKTKLAFGCCRAGLYALL